MARPDWSRRAPGEPDLALGGDDLDIGEPELGLRGLTLACDDSELVLAFSQSVADTRPRSNKVFIRTA
jgi:hypothetical protein